MLPRASFESQPTSKVLHRPDNALGPTHFERMTISKKRILRYVLYNRYRGSLERQPDTDPKFFTCLHDPGSHANRWARKKNEWKGGREQHHSTRYGELLKLCRAGLMDGELQTK